MECYVPTRPAGNTPNYSCGMPGVIAIVIALLLIPVIVLMSGGVLSAVLGFLLGRDADARFEGSELLHLDD
jgi:hypothetical protein